MFPTYIKVLNKTYITFFAVLVLLVICPMIQADEADSAFSIRGTLPWHNFLSGPSAWNLKDYEQYLDRLKELRLNFVGFHCYTGGGERYATYVEPMIRIEYRNVVPLAGFDTSLTARWAYRQLAVKDFAFGTSKLFDLPKGAIAFGSDCGVLAVDNEDRYKRAQQLMAKVLEMAHEREIQMAMGFEFGINPPEFASIVPTGSKIAGTILPDPTHPASIEILQATIDDILSIYTEIDWIWLWLHEHTMYVGRADMSGAFGELYDKEAHLFETGGDDIKFTGVWSLEYIRHAYSYIRQKAPDVRIAIGGWGGGTQLPSILKGLDKVLPKDIVFTCLNPDQGLAPQGQYLAEIAQNRPVWAVPWLEGDAKLWHQQMRVNLMREHVKLADKQKLNGIVAIHWRTEETRLNMDTFARFANDPDDPTTVADIYLQDCERHFGKEAADEIAPILTKMDIEQWFNAVDSPEYYPYDPSWGRINDQLRERLNNLIEKLNLLALKTKNDKHHSNMNWLICDFKFTLLLDEVSRKIEPAYNFKNRYLLGGIDPEKLSLEKEKARTALEAAPIEELFRTYAKRIRSRGELGVLSALNQKLWLQYKELKDFLGTVELPEKKSPDEIILFDGKTLDKWKITDFGGQGDVYIKESAVFLEMGNDMTGITWTGPIFKMNYEITLEAMRVSGNDFFCGLTFPVGDRPCTLILGGWGGTVTGLSSLDYLDASANETTTFINYEKGKWYNVRLCVEPGRIEAWLDDEKIISAITTGRNIGIRHEVELSKPLGISTWRTTGAIRNIKIRRDINSNGY